MEEKTKKKDKQSNRKYKRKSPTPLQESEEERSDRNSHFNESKRRKRNKDSENPKDSRRKRREGSENQEEYGRYWEPNGNHDMEDGEIKDYVPKERYWGNEDSKKHKRETPSKFDEDKYLVGSRYYIEPKNKRTNVTKNEKETNVKQPANQEPPPAPPPAKKFDVITSRTGGAYIPPGKLKLMQASITDKSSAEYQRIAWEALKKSIHGHINKVNTSNIGVVARLLFKENIIRGRGLLCRSIVQAQSASVTFTNVYASLVAIINSKFPNIGELLLKRVIIRFKRAYKRNDKAVCLSASTFIAHLINHRVAHEILGLELVTLLVENPTDDSIEVAVNFLKEAGQKLSEVTSKGTNAIFDMLRNILHEGKLEKRVQYMIEVMFQVRKDDFSSFPSLTEDLDLVDEEDQFTHLLTLDDAVDPQDLLNVFKLDSEYQANEEKYKELRSEILETDSEGSGSEGSSSGEDGSDDDQDEEQEEEKKTTIIDNTETNLIAFRKTIYLTIQSSLDFEECAHKLLKMDIKPGQEKELCHMFLDCCAEQRTYEKFFGLLSQRFCQVNKMFIAPFEEIFADTYSTVHRLDTNRLRNVAKLFAHLLFTDAISWAVLSTILLNEEDTTSSSRIFIKILFQELSEYMGLTNLNARLKDPTLQSAMEGLFPRDNPKNTRFAINFFTSIGLGGLTDELREHLKNLPKPVPVSQLIQELSSTSSSSSSSEESSSSESEESSSSSSSSSEDESPKKKKNKKKIPGKEKTSKKINKDKNKSKQDEKDSDENRGGKKREDLSKRQNRNFNQAEIIGKSGSRVERNLNHKNRDEDNGRERPPHGDRRGRFEENEREDEEGWKRGRDEAKGSRGEKDGHGNGERKVCRRKEAVDRDSQRERGHKKGREWNEMRRDREGNEDRMGKNHERREEKGRDHDRKQEKGRDRDENPDRKLKGMDRDEFHERKPKGRDCDENHERKPKGRDRDENHDWKQEMRQVRDEDRRDLDGYESRRKHGEKGSGRTDEERKKEIFRDRDTNEDKKRHHHEERHMEVRHHEHINRKENERNRRH